MLLFRREASVITLASLALASRRNKSSI